MDATPVCLFRNKLHLLSLTQYRLVLIQFVTVTHVLHVPACYRHTCATCSSCYRHTCANVPACYRHTCATCFGLLPSHVCYMFRLVTVTRVLHVSACYRHTCATCFGLTVTRVLYVPTRYRHTCATCSGLLPSHVCYMFRHVTVTVCYMFRPVLRPS